MALRCNSPVEVLKNASVVLDVQIRFQLLSAYPIQHFQFVHLLLYFSYVDFAPDILCWPSLKGIVFPTGDSKPSFTNLDYFSTVSVPSMLLKYPSGGTTNTATTIPNLIICMGVKT
ncbi:hypothetical protein BGZ54_007928 [Gamsiella multidivaricata]|nr:hypothetical protein BGZ54_007928 [Gamsiella multidivaricata]